MLAIAFNFDLILNNPEASNIYLHNSSSLTNLFKFYKPMIEVYKNAGATPIAFGYLGAGHNSVPADVLVSGDNTALSLIGNVTIGASNIDVSDTITIKLKVNTGGSPFLTWRRVSDDALTTVISTVEMASMKMQMSFTANSFGYTQLLKMNDFIPKKIKQKDLIKSVTTAFNLMVYPDKDNPNKIIYEARDSWLDSGSVLDWPEKIARDRPQNIQFLPELSAKKLLLTYKEDKDSYNTYYKDARDEVFGQVEFVFDSDFVKGIDKKEIIFSPTPIILNPNDSHAMSIVGGAPKSNIRLLIHNGALSCDPYNIYDFNAVGETGITTYANVGHFDHPTNPTIDINFAVCDYYFYDGITLTNNNLFNLFWRRTASQINNGKMLTAEFDLNSYDIQNLQLNDKVYIDNSWWNINQIIDFDANSDRLTKVELISVDDYADIPPYNLATTINPVKERADGARGRLIELFFEQKNLNLSSGNAVVIGKNNVVQEDVTAMVLGNDYSITDSGIYDSTVTDNGGETPATETRTVDIGSWNMTTTTNVTIPHGIVDSSKIRDVSVVIFSDAGLMYPLYFGGFFQLDPSDVLVGRTPGGSFDDTAFDDTAVNRGYITIHYFV